MLARGEVDQALKSRTSDDQWALHHPSQGQAVIKFEDGLRILTWAERDPDRGNIYQVSAESKGGRSDRTPGPSRRGSGLCPGCGIHSWAQRGGCNLRPGPGRGTLESSPPAPALHYNDQGALQSPGDLAQSLPFICADGRGRVYAVSHPLWNLFLQPSSLLRPLLVQFLSQDLPNGTIWDFMAELNMNLPNFPSAMLRFDLGGQSREALPPIPAFQMGAQGQMVPSGNYAVPGLLAQPTCNGQRLLVANWRPHYDLIWPRVSGPPCRRGPTGCLNPKGICTSGTVTPPGWWPSLRTKWAMSMLNSAPREAAQMSS